MAVFPHFEFRNTKARLPCLLHTRPEDSSDSDSVTCVASVNQAIRQLTVNCDFERENRSCVIYNLLDLSVTAGTVVYISCGLGV